MKRQNSSDQSVLLTDPRFLIATALSSACMGVAFIWGDLTIQISVAGLLISVLIGLQLSQTQATDELKGCLLQGMDSLRLAKLLSSDRELREVFEVVQKSLSTVLDDDKGIYRGLATDRLRSAVHEFEQVGQQELLYRGTELWRNAYARVLQDSRVEFYHSVAWVRSGGYWQDRPGQQSLDVNRDLLRRNVPVCRIVILSDSLCSGETSQSWPTELLSWLREQEHAGMTMYWIRESELKHEEDLLCDMGIYGNLAVGLLRTDDASRSLSFRLCFHSSEQQRCHRRWKQLMLYAHPGVPE